MKRKAEKEQKKRKKSTKQRSSKTSQQNPSRATLTGIATSKAKLDTSNVRYRRITQKIAGMMIHDFQPFAFVEDRVFKELTEQLEPRYNIPHRKTFSRSVIPGIYEEAKRKVKRTLVELQVDTKVALTTDMWTSEANEAYLGLTYHYLTQDFELVSTCLAVQHFT